jgi:hypothetical protein
MAPALQVAHVVLEWLVQRGQSREDERAAIATLRTDVATFLTPADWQIAQLPALRRESTGSAGPFLLPPVDDAIALPALKFSWDFAAATPELRLRVALFFPGSQGEAGEPKLLAVGYRYETPERGKRHRIHHVQAIASLDGPSGRPLPGARKHAPEQVPTLPLAAHDPLGLAACLVVSLYGMKLIDEMNGTLGGILQPSVRVMR